MHDDLILGSLGHDTPEGFRSGFVALVGRPNSGKSTLTNAMVGEKIAITANQPETTRHPVRGIVNRDLAQIVLVDTPGCGSRSGGLCCSCSCSCSACCQRCRLS